MPGDVYHVDSLVFDRRIVFAAASRYGTPPMAVAHEGGIFVTRTLPDEDATAKRLKAMNARVLESFGLLRGVSHTEFIREPRRRAVFPRDVRARRRRLHRRRRRSGDRASTCGASGPRSKSPASTAPTRRRCRKGAYAGIVLSLARQEQPDMSAYSDPEIVTRVDEAPPRGPDRVGARRTARAGAGRVVRLRASTATSTRPPRPPSARPTDLSSGHWGRILTFAECKNQDPTPVSSYELAGREKLQRDDPLGRGRPGEIHPVWRCPAAAGDGTAKRRCVRDVFHRSQRRCRILRRGLVRQLEDERDRAPGRTLDRA